MAFSREIIIKILQNIRFRVPQEEKDSYYTTIGNTLVRVSNHCTRLYVWDNFLEKNPNCKGMPIVSIVFEDNGSTFNETECLILKRIKRKPIKVNEYVYNLQGNPQFLNHFDERSIIASIKSISNGEYMDKTNKYKPFQRISINPITNNNNSVEENKNRQYMKQTIKLKESELKRMIYESINEVLNEVGDTPEGLHTLGRLIGRKYKQNGGNTKDDELINLAKYAEKRHQDQISKWDDDNDRYSHWYSRKSPDYNTYPKSWFDGFTSEIDTPVH